MARKTAQHKSGSESFSVRLGARTKYGLELIARNQRRSLSSLAESTFHELIRHSQFTSLTGGTRPLSQVLEDLWDPFEADRVVNLAQMYPALLTYEEDLAWKVVKGEPSFWKNRKTTSGEESAIAIADALQSNAAGRPTKRPRDPNMERIRAQWETIKAAANGEPVDFATSKEG